MKTSDVVKKIREAIDARKGEDVVVFDVRNISELADYFVIATGNSPPHLRAMADEMHVSLKQQGVMCYRRSGEPESGWLVMDYADVIVHLFMPEKRQYYAVEELLRPVSARPPVKRRTRKPKRA